MNAWIRVLSAALSVAALAGCGSGPEMKLTCSGTVAGGFESMFSRCTGFDQIYRQNQDTFSLNLGYDEVGSTPGLDYSVAATTESRGIAQTGKNIEPECTVSVTKGGQTWKATRGLTGVTSGSCTLRYSEVVPWTQTGNTITYCILRGRLDAQLVEDPPTADSVNVNLRLDFDYAPSVAGDDPDKQRALCPQPAM